MMQAKKLIMSLVAEGKLKYWSSGSTTLYMLPEGSLEKEEKGWPKASLLAAPGVAIVDP